MESSVLIMDGTMDVGVTTVPDHPDGSIAVVPLFHEEFVLAVCADHPMAKAKAIPFDHLRQIRMFMFGAEHQITKRIRACCEAKELVLDNPIVTSTLSTLLSLVGQGLGGAILPRLLLEYMRPDNIAAVTLLDPTPSQDICTLYRTDKYLSQAARIFMDDLVSFVESVKAQAALSSG